MYTSFYKQSAYKNWYTSILMLSPVFSDTFYKQSAYKNWYTSILMLSPVLVIHFFCLKEILFKVPLNESAKSLENWKGLVFEPHFPKKKVNAVSVDSPVGAVSIPGAAVSSSFPGAVVFFQGLLWCFQKKQCGLCYL